MFGWFKPKSPLTVEQVRWMDERFAWLRNEFGERRLGGPVVAPTNEFFPDLYRGTHDDAAKIFDRVCECMGVERARVNLRLYRDAKVDSVHSNFSPLRQDYVAGVYDERPEVIDIWLETTRLDEPEMVVAVLAHELAHVHLLGDRRYSPEQEDHERLTDLLVVYFGLGIFNANVSLQDRHWRAGRFSGWSMGTIGYLSLCEFAYALAKFAHARREYNPSWARHLRKDVRSLFKVELEHLIQRGHVAAASAAGSSTAEESAACGSSGCDCNGGCSGACCAKDTDDEVEEAVGDDESHDRQESDQLFELGVVHNATKEFQLAAEVLARAVELKPSDDEAWSELARAYLGLGKFAAAAEACTRSLEIDPENLETISRRATAYIWLRRYADAIADSGRVIAEARKMAVGWHLHGLAYLGMGNPKRAVDDLTKAIRYAPTWGETYLARSRAFEQLGDPRRAQVDLFEAIRRTPQFADEAERARSLAMVA